MKKRMLLAVGCMTAFFAFSQNDTYNGEVIVGKDTMQCVKSDYNDGFWIKDKSMDSLRRFYTRSINELDEANLELKQGRARKILYQVSLGSNESILKAFRETFTYEELQKLSEEPTLRGDFIFTNEGKIMGISFALEGIQRLLPYEKWVILAQKLKSYVILNVPQKDMKFMQYRFPFYFDKIKEKGLASHPNAYHPR